MTQNLFKYWHQVGPTRFTANGWGVPGHITIYVELALGWRMDWEIAGVSGTDDLGKGPVGRIMDRAIEKMIIRAQHMIELGASLDKIFGMFIADSIEGVFLTECRSSLEKAYEHLATMWRDSRSDFQPRESSSRPDRPGWWWAQDGSNRWVPMKVDFDEVDGSLLVILGDGDVIPLDIYTVAMWGPMLEQPKPPWPGYQGVVCPQSEYPVLGKAAI